jgi:hypothetical protein
LVGLGASIAYVSDEIASHPRKEALFEAMFAELGLDMLRLRNRYGYTGDDNLASQSEIVAAAASSLGRPPVVMLTSWSPPAALKANGASQCAGEPQSCTLSKTSAGAFDYQGFAAHWRASLDAYAKVGVSADFIGIQNHPNWTPPASTPMEACLFLPKEGVRTLSIDGANVQVTFPGFAEAMSAVAGQLSGLAHVPAFAAPEVNGAEVVVEFAPELDFSRVAAVAHHVYDFDPKAIDADTFTTVSDVAQQYQRPIFLTEGVADGFGTAVLLHYALAVEGASVYLQNDLVGSALDTAKEPKSLLSLGSDDFTTQAPYHALRHFAHYTDSKWVRVGATSTRSSLLSSAWLSPDETSLTVVLVNTGSTAEDAKLELDGFSFTDSQVVRTVFDGAERSSELGALPVERIVRVPGRSALTVALLRRE